MACAIELLKAIVSLVSAAGIVIGIQQLWMARQVWKTQHDRLRREKAIESIRHYTNVITPSWSATKKIVERLSDEQLVLMDQGLEFSIDGKDVELLKVALPNEPFNPGSSQITLNCGQSYKLRHQALFYLNAVEVIFQAWYWDVVEPEIIHEEMAHLRDPDANPPATMMENYRKALKLEKNYPALYRYIAGEQPRRLTETSFSFVAAFREAFYPKH